LKNSLQNLNSLFRVSTGYIFILLVDDREVTEVKGVTQVKRVLGIAFASAILVIPTTAKAEWIYVTSSNRADTYLEDSSIKQQQDIVMYSKSDIYFVPLKGRIKTVITTEAVSCSNDTAVTIRSTAFASDGRQLNENPYILNSVRNVVPGTIGYAEKQTVCGN
jgi:hypothetical protein